LSEAQFGVGTYIPFICLDERAAGRNNKKHRMQREGNALKAEVALGAGEILTE